MRWWNIVGKIRCFGIYFWSHPQAWWKQESPCFHQAWRWDRKDILQHLSYNVVPHHNLKELHWMFWCFGGVVPSSLGWLNWVKSILKWCDGWNCACYIEWHRMAVGSLANHSWGRWGGWDCHKPVGLENSKIDPSQGLTYWGSENNVDVGQWYSLFLWELLLGGVGLVHYWRTPASFFLAESDREVSMTFLWTVTILFHAVGV